MPYFAPFDVKTANDDDVYVYLKRLRFVHNTLPFYSNT